MRVLLLAAFASAADIPVLTVQGTIRHVSFGQIATQPGALNATVNALTHFFRAIVCSSGSVTDLAEVNFPPPAPAPSAPAPVPAAPVPDGIPTAPVQKLAEDTATSAPATFIQQLQRWTVANATNATNGTDASTTDCAGGDPIVLLWYGSMQLLVELDYSKQAEEVFKDPNFPRVFSNFLLTVPQVILYADQPPIVASVEVNAKNVTPMVAACAGHVPKIISSFHHSYTNRMTPWALDAACGYFMSGMSFTTEEKPTEDDRVFCETASKHLMNTHFAGEQDYESWCHAVCEHRHGPTRVCKMPESANATGARNATSASFTHVQRRLRRAKARVQRS